MAIDTNLTITESSGLSDVVSVFLINDRNVEGNETFSLQLSTSSPSTELATVTATIVIIDDDRRECFLIAAAHTKHTITLILGLVLWDFPQLQSLDCCLAMKLSGGKPRLLKTYVCSMYVCMYATVCILKHILSPLHTL